MKDLSKQSAEFLWFQLFRHVILRLPQNQQAKQQMISICRDYYRGNTKELELIDQFQREYRADEAIRWYSKNSFVYRSVNKALRAEDVEQLYTFRFFIGDLSNSLAREHEKILSAKERVLTLYRGAKLDREEFDKLKQNQGRLISTNGYLSTSRLRSPALAFANKPTKRADTIPVLFEIRCDIKKIGKSVVLADIATFSQYPGEQEVLFDLSTVFLLESIKEDQGVQLIRMNASNDGEAITKDYLELIRVDSQERSFGIIFGRLMCDLGEYDKSQKYFEQLLKEPEGEDIAWIEFNIGRALYLKGEWREARKYYDRAYNRMENVQPARIKETAYVLNNIGIILDSQERYAKALEYHQRALVMKKNYYSSDHVDIAISLHNIGFCFYNQKKYVEALHYYQQALEIEQKYYPPAHPNIALSFNNIAIVLMQQEKYNEALKHNRCALDMQEKHYPTGHIDIATSLHNIGNIFREKRSYVEALDYNQRALKMQEKYYPLGHIDIATTLHNIGLSFYYQEKYEEALSYYQQALTMQEKYYPSDHISTIDIRNDIKRCNEKREQEITELLSKIGMLDRYDKNEVHIHQDIARPKCRSSACVVQ